MQHITPYLWFDHQAEEAVNFYVSVFQNSAIGKTMRFNADGAKMSGMAEGSVMSVDFTLCGLNFGTINGGPLFQLTPATSFFVNCETTEQADILWQKLSEGGNVLMEYGTYPWSEKYGWCNDRYGVSWQISLSKGPQRISPALLFTQNVYGKAEEAVNFYVSLFPNSHLDFIQRRKENMGTERAGTVEYAAFTLMGQSFNAMEGNQGHAFSFTEAVSFAVNCETQEEIDRLWNALSAVPESEQCGWLKDKYGVSWQILPANLQQLLTDPDPARAQRAMKAMLQMKKLDIAQLEAAAEG